MKVWFITGASRGLGRAIAESALERGDQVAATARDTPALEPLIDRWGDAVLPLQLDVIDRVAVRAAVDRAHEAFQSAARGSAMGASAWVVAGRS